jgi:hypothetical protein
MPSIGADGEWRPQRYAIAIDRGHDAANTPVLDKDVTDVSTFTHHYTGVPRAIEEESVEPVAREPDRGAPWLSGPEIGEKTVPAGRMDEHGLHAVRP